MTHSTAEKRNNPNKQPKFTATFIYQKQLIIEKNKKLISNKTEQFGVPNSNQLCWVD